MQLGLDNACRDVRVRSFTFTIEEEVSHVMAERSIHKATLELTRHTAAIEGADGVGTVGKEKVQTMTLFSRSSLSSV